MQAWELRDTVHVLSKAFRITSEWYWFSSIIAHTGGQAAIPNLGCLHQLYQHPLGTCCQKSTLLAHIRETGSETLDGRPSNLHFYKPPKVSLLQAKI